MITHLRRMLPASVVTILCFASAATTEVARTTPARAFGAGLSLSPSDYNGQPNSCKGERKGPLIIDKTVNGGYPGMDYCCGPLNCRDGNLVGYGPVDPFADNCAW